VPDVRGIKVDRLLNQPKSQHFGVKINILLWVTRDSGDVVNPVWVNAH
jgi:hypothetical protein